MTQISLQEAGLIMIVMNDKKMESKRKSIQRTYKSERLDFYFVPIDKLKEIN